MSSMRDFFTSRIVKFWLMPNTSGDDVDDGWGPADGSLEPLGPFQGIVKTYSTGQDVQLASGEQLEAATVLFSFHAIADEEKQYDRIKIGDHIFSIVDSNELPLPVDRIKSRIVLKKVL